MAVIFRVVTRWTGFTGAPGYTNHFFRNIVPGGAPTNVDDSLSALAAGDKVQTFWNAIKGAFPDDVTFNVESNIDAIEDTTGALVATYQSDARAAIRGTQAGSYSAATGAVVQWTTNAIRRRRRIRGRTFLVPLAGVVFGSVGRINAADVGILQTAATNLATGGVNNTFGVWARPSGPGAEDGQWAEASGARVTDLPAVLRSRRD